MSISTPSQQPSIDPKDEYKHVNDNLRHYGNMRFAQTTLLTAITAGILKAVYSEAIQLSHVRLFAILGLIVTVLFTIMELRASKYWHQLKGRADELETQYLHYKQWHTRLSGGIVSISSAGKLLHVLAILFWFVIIFWHPGVSVK
jgi:hypothetical protein